MPQARLKLWVAVPVSLGVAAAVIRAVWQIVVIPTAGTMLIFIPAILGTLMIETLVVYLLLRPQKLGARAFRVGMTVALSAGLLAAAVHYARFIISPVAEPFWSKVIGTLLMMSCLSAWAVLVRLVWQWRRHGQQEI